MLAPEVKKAKRELVLKDPKNVNTEIPEIQEALKYLKNRPFTSFPYFWTLKYENYTPEIFKDQVSGFSYIIFKTKKLYFPKSFSHQQITWTTRGILREQDPQSAHLYLTDRFNLDENTILIDAGVAEGSFSLENIEKVKQLHLIECDPMWVEALKLTFNPWKEKVIIYEKYLSDKNENEYITIDSIINPDHSDHYFIKLDIESYELKAIQGMENLLTKAKNIKMSVCTYHRPSDAQDIALVLKKFDFSFHFSNGFILFNFYNETPTFRKGLIRAEKN
jgi:hypothetical protein